MPKRYFLTKKQFKKMYSTARETNDLLFVSKCFSDNSFKDICEIECIIPILKYMETNLDNLLCMLSYIETKDEDLKDVFN